jgi:nucleolin
MSTNAIINGIPQQPHNNNGTRFVIKRVAVRAIVCQPTRQLCTLRPATRVTAFSKPALLRSFHQTRIWRAEEEQKKPTEEASPAEATTTGETVSTEPTASEEAVKAEREEVVVEKSIATPEVQKAAAPSESAQAPETTAAQDAVAESSGTISASVDQPEAAEPSQTHTITEKAQEVASSAAEAVSSTASATASAASDAFDAVRPRRDGPTDPLPRRRERPNNAPNRILYIGNLFFEVTAPQLEAEFGKFGEITNSRVVTDNRGLSKGFAYVEFAKQEDADVAVKELDQKVFQGRRMAVQYHQPREGRTPRNVQQARNSNTPTKTLFIGNMSYQMSDRDLNGMCL